MRPAQTAFDNQLKVASLKAQAQLRKAREAAARDAHKVKIELSEAKEQARERLHSATKQKLKELLLLFNNTVNAPTKSYV